MDRGHNGDVTRATRDDVQAYLADRFHEHTASGRHSADDVVAKVNVEAEMFDKGAWNATCSCGWAGNNPYPSRESAVSSLTKHYQRLGVMASDG